MCCLTPCGSPCAKCRFYFYLIFSLVLSVLCLMCTLTLQDMLDTAGPIVSENLVRCNKTVYRLTILHIVLISLVLVVTTITKLCNTFVRITTFLVLILMAVVTAAVVVSFYLLMMSLVKFNLKQSMESNLDKTIYWNKIHSQNKCCGIKGPIDWKNSVPNSCCVNEICSQYYNDGCYMKMFIPLWLYDGLTLFFLSIMAALCLCSMMDLIKIFFTHKEDKIPNQEEVRNRDFRSPSTQPAV